MCADLVCSSGRQAARTAASPTMAGAARYSSFCSRLVAVISPAHPHTPHMQLNQPATGARSAMGTGTDMGETHVAHDA